MTTPGGKIAIEVKQMGQTKAIAKITKGHIDNSQDSSGMLQLNKSLLCHLMKINKTHCGSCTLIRWERVGTRQLEKPHLLVKL